MRLNIITLILLFAWCWIPNNQGHAYLSAQPLWNAAGVAKSLPGDTPFLFQITISPQIQDDTLANKAFQATEIQEAAPTPTPRGEEIPQPTDVRLMRTMILLAAISAAVILIGVWINRQRANLR